MLLLFLIDACLSREDQQVSMRRVVRRYGSHAIGVPQILASLETANSPNRSILLLLWLDVSRLKSAIAESG
jgi:hypothetical protein